MTFFDWKDSMKSDNKQEKSRIKTRQSKAGSKHKRIKPAFPWSHCFVLSLIGISGVLFNIACAVDALNDRFSSSGVVMTFAILALLFLLGWMWVISLLVKGHKGRTKQYEETFDDGSAHAGERDKQNESFRQVNPMHAFIPNEPVYDLDSWDPIFKETDSMASDFKGKFYQRLDENTVMDMDTGEIHWTTPWSADDQ